MLGRLAVARSRATLFGFVIALGALALAPLVLFHATHPDHGDRRPQPPARAHTARWDKRAASPGAVGLQAVAQDRLGHEQLHYGLSAIQRHRHDPDLSWASREEIAAGSTAAARHQQTNRTPLTHAGEEGLREPSAASLRVDVNSSTAGSIEGPSALESSVSGSVSAHSAAKESDARPPPAPATLGAEHVAAPSTDCGGERPITPWDEPEATSTAGEECSVHSDSLNAVFHQRFEFAPGTLKIGGGYDSEYCYAYAGNDCWVAGEVSRAATSPCVTPDTDTPPLPDDEPNAAADALPGRDDLMWQLRRALNQGRVSAPDDAEGGVRDDLGDNDDFGASFGSFRFGGGFPAGPWGRRALDVALDVAAAVEGEVLASSCARACVRGECWGEQ